MRMTNAEGYSYEPVSTVSGKPPYPAEQVERSRELLRATLAMFQPFGHTTSLAQQVFTKYPVHAERAKAAAAVVGVDPVELVEANLCYDMPGMIGSMACSTLALAGSEGPVLARNMDWFPAEKIAKASCLVTEDFGVNAGFVGMLGAVTGLSRNGFCVCLNAAFGGSDLTGYPVLLFLRHVLDSARSYQEALSLVQTEPLMTAGIITVVGTRNEERAIVERTPRNAVVRSPRGDEPLMATNHFRKLTAPEVCSRYEYMARHAGGSAQPLDMLTSRNVLQEITAQHVVMCPATQRADMYVPSHLLSDHVREEPSAADLIRFFS